MKIQRGICKMRETRNLLVVMSFCNEYDSSAMGRVFLCVIVI